MQPKVLHETERLLLLERDGWEWVERKKGKAAVAVMALTTNGEIILTEQARKPVDARVIDLPAGLIGDEDQNEDATTTAKRELEEEAGSSPGITSEKIVLVRAHGVSRRGAGGGVGGEKIAVHLVPLAEAGEWLREREREGILVDMKVWAGLYFVAKSA
jgi:ADP-ribose pyrophosphatase